jgi:serine/threonine protein kinase
MGSSASLVASQANEVKNFHANYSLEEKIGIGGYGVVHKARLLHEDKDRTFAVKILAKKSPNGDSSSVVKKRFEAEVDMLTHCKGKNVIELVQVFQNRQFFYAVMEHGHCTVLQALLDSTDVSESHLARCFAGMMEGIAHCHKMKVVHRDIKPQNFLLTQGTKITDERCTVKLCDLGMAAKMPDRFDSLTGFYGTCPFIAPEIVQNQCYNYKVDVWSFGVTAYLMLFGVYPYNPQTKDGNDMLELIHSGQTPIAYEAKDDSKQPSEEAVVFLKKLLNRDPDSRPTATSVLLMPYVKKYRGAQCDDSISSPSMKGGPPPRASRSFEASALSRHTLKDVLHPQFDMRYASFTEAMALPTLCKRERSDSDASTTDSSSQLENTSDVRFDNLDFCMEHTSNASNENSW